jgi:methionine biosynthesis protein MetW
LFFKGKTPVTPALPYQWYDTPNLHFLSISDFTDYCKKKRVRIEKMCFIGKRSMIVMFSNLFAQIGIFVISRE